MSSINALLPINTSGLTNIPRDIPVDEPRRGPSRDVAYPTARLREAENNQLTDGPISADTNDRLLPPEEAMNATLPQVSSHLDQALLAFAAGQTDQACARLEEAAGLLDNLIAAIVPAAVNESTTTVNEPTAAEAPRAMAAAA
jgi:hypothetical protein